MMTLAVVITAIAHTGCGPFDGDYDITCESSGPTCISCEDPACRTTPDQERHWRKVQKLREESGGTRFPEGSDELWGPDTAEDNQ